MKKFLRMNTMREGTENPFEPFFEEIRCILREELRTVKSQPSRDNEHVPAPKSDRTYLTVAQAAELAGLGPSTIRLYIRRRQLRAQKVGRRVLIKRSDLERFLEAHPIEAITG